MGTSTNAMLVYGYNLGAGDGEWEIAEVDGYGSPKLDWYGTNEDDEDDEDEGFTELAMKRLLTAAGFTETDYKVAGYFDRQKAAEKQVGVEFDSYCSGDYPMWVLAARIITVRRGDCGVIDFAELTAEAEAGDYDTKLANAIQVLGITPKQERPRWLLVSYWG